ncbi:hypothetical protein M0802_015947 [Mischocyttarus mexicanus]|nr:hypothetical protein M0802_015947 [Mischocyttarus mexicanus]
MAVLFGLRTTFPIVDIEKVQLKFLRLAANHCGLPMPFNCHNYDSILDFKNWSTLCKRRMASDIIFIWKIVNGFINCPGIINILSLNVPLKNFRCNELLYIKPHRSNYGYYSSFNKMILNVNFYFHHFNIFSDLILIIRNILQRML